MSAEITTHSAPRDPDTLERQNEELRADMGRTIEALEQKLSPGQLLDRALEMLKEHGGEWTSNLGGTIKQNPVPMLLTTVGIAWLMSTQNRATAGYVRESDSTDSGNGRWKERLQNAGDRANEARSRINDAAHRVGDQASAARARLHETADSVRHSAHATADRGRRASARLQSTFEEQPLVLGAIGVALGAILGGMLPSTESEDRLMGKTRDHTLQRARAAGETKLESAGETASHATESAKRAWEEEQQRHH